MQTKQDRTALIAVVTGVIALMLGLGLGVFGGGVAGYVIGRQVERNVQQDRAPSREAPMRPEMPEMPGMPALPEMPEMPGMPEMPEMPALPEMPEMPMLPGRLQQAAGALVQQVLPDSPAQAAGLRAGDLITGVDDVPIDANHPLSEVLGAYEPGAQVTLQVWRGARTITLSATLGTNPQDAARPYLGVRYVDWEPVRPQD